MLKEFVEKIVSLAENKTYTIGDSTYSDKHLVRVAPHVDRPRELEIYGLESVVKLINAEFPKLGYKLFVNIVSPRQVDVFTTYTEDFSRDRLYTVRCDIPQFREGFREQQQALIELRSKFIENEGTAYLLELLSKITTENNVASSDNGVTQTVEAKQGIALAARVSVKPRVNLAPYRTFLEVAQPESEFLLRLNSDGDIGLFEADGGMWQLEAKRRIKAYFEEMFKGMSLEQNVTVMM